MTARRRHLRAVRDCCPLPYVFRGVVGFDWSGHQTGPAMPCRICRRPAWCRDCVGKPCHKACAEAEATRELALDQRTAAGATA
ncbi:hypothetical protein GCM10018962_77490 [Dactylosporangium matsuzakiense]